MKTLFSSFLFALVVVSGISQAIDKAKLDSYFNALEASNKFMGSVALSQNGKVIYTKVIGYSDVESNKKANTESRYKIGSISKTFTSVLVFKSIEQNKLSLSQTIDKFFPEIKNAKQITVSHLLHHRSGIHSFTDDANYLSYAEKPMSEKELLDIIIKGGSDFKPDSKADYSNSNYVLLTFILERIHKKTYAELLGEYIINPLDLKRTSIGQKINLNNNDCNSYAFEGAWIKGIETDPSVPLGAGAIVSTPTDLTTFSNALFHGKLINAKSLELMKEMQDGYGAGLFESPFYDKKSYGHTGGIDGFSSDFGYLADGDVSMAIISNGNNYSINEISIVLLSAVYGMDYSIPSFTSIEVSDEVLKQYVGVYSSSSFPLKITVSINQNTLYTQATGQSAFPVEATAKDEFQFHQAGIVLQFDTTKHTMLLKQGGGEFLLTRE